MTFPVSSFWISWGIASLAVGLAGWRLSRSRTPAPGLPEDLLAVVQSAWIERERRAQHRLLAGASIAVVIGLATHHFLAPLETLPLVPALLVLTASALMLRPLLQLSALLAELDQRYQTRDGLQVLAANAQRRRETGDHLIAHLRARVPAPGKRAAGSRALPGLVALFIAALGIQTAERALRARALSGAQDMDSGGAGAMRPARVRPPVKPPSLEDEVDLPEPPLARRLEPNPVRPGVEVAPEHAATGGGHPPPKPRPDRNVPEPVEGTVPRPEPAPTVQAGGTMVASPEPEGLEIPRVTRQELPVWLWAN